MYAATDAVAGKSPGAIVPLVRPARCPLLHRSARARHIRQSCEAQPAPRWCFRDCILNAQCHLGGMLLLFARKLLLILLLPWLVAQLRPCGTVIVYGVLAGWEITVPMGPLFKVI